MPTYFATCARGLEPILAKELEGIGAADITPDRGGVNFSGEAVTLYKANLWLRTAVRLLQPLFNHYCETPEDLYEACRTVKWFDLMTPDHTLAVDCNVRDSGITHSQYAARKVKDAICDQFRDRTGRRPSVDVETPMIGLNLHIHRNRAILSLDSSWNSLHKRGYRPIQTRAPINEALACGLLMHLGYDGSTPLVDFMCGSGTFLVEGAWLALKRPPGLTRKWFSFYGWRDFNARTWSRLRDEARDQMANRPAQTIVGSDVLTEAVELAIRNTAAAGVGNMITVQRMPLKDARPPEGSPPGWIIVNPPYGERLGEEGELVPLYRSLGDRLGAHWPGWKLAVFTSNDYLAKKIQLPVLRRSPFFNGSIQCHLWEYGAG
jgi:putative N6-adenine-specific DNA methylase